MQKIYNKFHFILLLLIALSIQPVYSQEFTSKINLADSLFEQKKYTESFELYQEILEKGHQLSPRMLLKMSFIKEGLGDYSDALYYLNLYYLHTSNKKVLKKMEEMAEKHKLQGYAYSDMDFFLTLYFKYSLYITFSLLALSFLVFVLMFHQKKRLQKRPVIGGVFFTIILALLFYHINFNDTHRKGIIMESDTYLMEAPSAGADLVEIVKKGHRVDIKGQQDVWIEIEWAGQKAFVRENNIATIQ
ncbi:SH3 domain-containing protein [Fulvivirgaceae bacterium BMA10]|uniref:SH3 domain-containing protein n=1 Tax=Splendidivirga corallicola TaxID=3051826 RepID=A0ABT8KMJ8_9BACT|nr:SH3 domain-containing protein [Fulvivirgaceae bacterium BMA10]